jgi:type II secretory pathway pseudopilin PulG
VELLVVITIIGILASLITVAAVGALRKARETEIKAEVDQIATALEDYKNKTTAYPPNCQTDDASDAKEPATSATPLDEGTILNDLKRHLKQAFPRHQESENLLRAMVGLQAVGGDAGNYPQPLAGGMTAGEALVFWLGGFSSDPKYPISGDGGPSYRIDNLGSGVDPYQADPIETRKWVFPFAVGRLAPRDANGEYFDPDSLRYIEYTDAKGVRRRINFWQYVPRKSEQPYLYFDTSRGAPTPMNDPPAATALTGLGEDEDGDGEPDGLHVHTFKKLSDSAGAATAVQSINPDKFQVLHCGIDEAWDVEAFERMSVHAVTDPNDFLLFPDGPFIGEIADTIVNFAPVTRIEDAQP